MATTTESLIKIAGPPGSGKSMALVREVARLIKAGEAQNHQVRILTTSRNQLDRIEGYVQLAADQSQLPNRSITVQTFEQFCLDLIRHYDPGFPPQTQLLTVLEAQLLLQQIGEDIAKNAFEPDDPLYFAIQTSGFAYMLSQLLRQFQTLELTPDRLESAFNTRFPAVPVRQAQAKTKKIGSRIGIFVAFQRRFIEHCQQHHLLTYRDLTERTETLLRENPAVLKQVQRDLDLVAIDEAQELSQRRFQLLAHLHPDTQLILAGNPDLSITEFRGASPAWFDQPDLAFGQNTAVTHFHFPHEITCFRNNEPLLWWLSQWQQEKQFGATLWEISPNSEAEYAQQLAQRVRFTTEVDPDAEIHTIADTIHRMRREEGLAWTDFAILLRQTGPNTPFQDRLSSIFSDRGIPVGCSALPEEGRALKTMVFHALRTFECCERLGLKKLTDPAWQANQPALSTLTRTEIRTQLRQHMRAWFTLANPLSTVLTWQDVPRQADGPNEVNPWLLVSDGALVSTLDDAYQHYLETSTLFPLCWTILEHSVEGDWMTGVTPVLSSFGQFLQTLQSLDQKPDIRSSLRNLEHWFPPMWQQESVSTSSKEGVQVMGIQQVQGDEFPVVFIPNMTAVTFPRSAAEHLFFELEESECLRQTIMETGHDPLTLPLDLSDKNREALLKNEAQLMTLAASRAQSHLFLSTHEEFISDEGRSETVQPSLFFTDLKQVWHTLTGMGDTKKNQPSSVRLSETVSRPFHGNSVWSALEKQAETALFDTDEVLKLSPTGVTNYIRCPRRFYYQQLLRIQTESGQAAAEGSLIHKLMEILNQQLDEQPYTAERLHALTQALFERAESDEPARKTATTDESIPVDEQDVQRLRSYSPIARTDLKNRIEESIDSMARHGYFDEQPQRAEAEKSFSFRPKNIDRVEFNGKIDALIQRDDGTWDLLDYKTSRSALDHIKPEKRLEQLLQVFEPMNAEETDHDAKFGGDRIQRNYQIPIYYMALQHDDTFAQHIGQCGLQMIRPDAPGKSGSVAITTDAGTIETHVEPMLKDLSQCVINPILEAATLDPNPGDACDFCPYTAVCDAAHQTTGTEEAGHEN